MNVDLATWIPIMLSTGTLIVALLILFRKIPKESDISVMRGDLDKISNNLKEGLALNREATLHDLDRLQNHLMDLLKVQFDTLSSRMDRFEERMDRRITRIETRVDD